MKKIIGFVMMAIAVIMFAVAFLIPEQAEAMEVSEMKAKLETVTPVSVSASPEPATTTSVPEDTFYSDTLSHEHGQEIGVLEIGDDISVVVKVGANDNDDIVNCAGVHETLSADNHLVIFAHHTSNGTLFGNLKNVEEGSTVKIQTVDGTKLFKVVDSQYYTVDEMTANDFELLRGEENLVLVTCDWDDAGVKGRRIVFCQEQ